MLTDIIPEIIKEPIKVGFADGNETVGYLAGEISRLRSVLKQILKQTQAALKSHSEPKHRITKRQKFETTKRQRIRIPKGWRRLRTGEITAKHDWIICVELDPYSKVIHWEELIAYYWNKPVEKKWRPVIRRTTSRRKTPNF